MSSLKQEDIKNEKFSSRLERCKLIGHLEYSYEPGTSKVSIKKRILYLDNIKIQDLREWVNTVNDAVKVSKWSDEDSVEIVSALIRIPFTKSKDNYLIIKEIFDDLFNEYYPKENSVIYLERLKEIKQEKYFWIKDYIEDINKEIINLSISSKLTKKEMERKFEETFITGLCIET